MPDLGPLDPEVLNRMRSIIRGTIATRDRSVAEAAAEARGFGRASHPALPITAIDEALVAILRELGAYDPPRTTVEQDGQTLRLASPEEVADSLSFALRFNHRGRALRSGSEHAAAVAADNLVRHLAASGYLLLKTGRPDAWDLPASDVGAAADYT